MKTGWLDDKTTFAVIAEPGEYVSAFRAMEAWNEARLEHIDLFLDAGERKSGEDRAACYRWAEELLADLDCTIDTMKRMPKTSGRDMRERRDCAWGPTLPVQSVRAEAQSGYKISGYSSVFYKPGVPGTEYKLASHLVERIDRGAFDEALKSGSDVRGLFNHDPNQVLGSTAAGTMKLSTDDTGLRYEIFPNLKTQVGNDVLEYTRRGDVRGSSFAFQARVQTMSRDGSNDVRTIMNVVLYDSGPVVFPAYAAATTGAA